MKVSRQKFIRQVCFHPPIRELRLLHVQFIALDKASVSQTAENNLRFTSANGDTISNCFDVEI